MNKTAVTIFFLLLFGLFGLMWWGSRSQATAPSKEAQATKSTLVANETLYDFRTISMAKGKVSRIFKVTNPTGKDIFVSSLTTSCMCTAAYIINPNGSKKGPYGMPGMGYVPKADEMIKAGETRDIEVVYDPAAHGPAGVGSIDRFIYLEDETGGILQLEIKALVTP